MASSTKAFVAVAVLILSLIHEGFCDCSLDDIIVGTIRTGRIVQGKTEWKVTVTNNCKCSQGELRLLCQGFQSAEPVDPNVFQKQDDKCLVINGNALKGFSTVSFAYAWDPPFVLWPAGSIVEPC